MSTWVLVIVLTSTFSPRAPIVALTSGFSSKHACEIVAAPMRSHSEYLHGQWANRSAICIKEDKQS